MMACNSGNRNKKFVHTPCTRSKRPCGYCSPSHPFTWCHVLFLCNRPFREKKNPNSIAMATIHLICISCPLALRFFFQIWSNLDTTSQTCTHFIYWVGSITSQNTPGPPILFTSLSWENLGTRPPETPQWPLRLIFIVSISWNGSYHQLGPSHIMGSRCEAWEGGWKGGGASQN